VADLTTAFSRPDVDTEPTIEVAALGVYVVHDGDHWAAEPMPARHQVCHCEDDRHDRRDRDDMGRSWPTEFLGEAEAYAQYHGGHVVTLHPFAYVTGGAA